MSEVTAPEHENIISYFQQFRTDNYREIIYAVAGSCRAFPRMS